MSEPTPIPPKPLPVSQRALTAPQAIAAVLALIVAAVVLHKLLGGDDAPAAGTADLPWVATARAACASYKAAPNEIQKSAIFTQATEALATSTVHGARGKLTRLQTSQGGASLALAIEAGGATFKTESLLAPIERGSPVHLAASSMTVGQCVIFDAEKLRPSALTEQSKVCDVDYFATVSALAPCP